MGRFKNEEDAARAYDKKAKELYGNDANLNFPEQKAAVSPQVITQQPPRRLSIDDGETWKDVPKFEGYYQISKSGKVKSVERSVQITKNGSQHLKRIKERLLKTKNGTGRHSVVLVKPNTRIRMYIEDIIHAVF